MKSLASLGWSFALIAAAGFLFAIFALAYLAGGLEVVRRWRRRRALRNARKWGMVPGAFKPVSKHWWAS